MESRYQLRQPPAVHTLPLVPRSTSARKRSCASARGSIADRPVCRRHSSASIRYSTWASIINSTELWPRPVFGPSRKNRFGKARHRHAEMRLRAALPGLGEGAAVWSVNAVADRRVGDLEPGAEDDRVGAVHDAVGVADPVRGHRVDAAGHDLRVLGAQRRIPGVGAEDPLAPEAVVGSQLGAQLGVGDLALEVAQRLAFEHLHQPRVLEADVERLLEREDDAPGEREQPGVAVRSALATGPACPDSSAA